MHTPHGIATALWEEKDASQSGCQGDMHDVPPLESCTVGTLECTAASVDGASATATDVAAVVLSFRSTEPALPVPS
jgi:hypothetical protein